MYFVFNFLNTFNYFNNIKDNLLIFRVNEKTNILEKLDNTGI